MGFKLKKFIRPLRKVAQVALPIAGFAVGGPMGAAAGGALGGAIAPGARGAFSSKRLMRTARGGLIGGAAGLGAGKLGLVGGQGFGALGRSFGNLSLGKLMGGGGFGRMSEGGGTAAEGEGDRGFPWGTVLAGAGGIAALKAAGAFEPQHAPPAYALDLASPEQNALTRDWIKRVSDEGFTSPYQQQDIPDLPATAVGEAPDLGPKTWEARRLDILDPTYKRAFERGREAIAQQQAKMGFGMLRQGPAMEQTSRLAENIAMRRAEDELSDEAQFRDLQLRRGRFDLGRAESANLAAARRGEFNLKRGQFNIAQSGENRGWRNFLSQRALDWATPRGKVAITPPAPGPSAFAQLAGPFVQGAGQTVGKRIPDWLERILGG